MFLILIFTTVVLGANTQYATPTCNWQFGQSGNIVHYTWFQDNNPNITYQIGTTWLLSYNNIIKHKLKNHGFNVLENNNLNSCAWIPVSEIYETIIYRGFQQLTKTLLYFIYYL